MDEIRVEVVYAEVGAVDAVIVRLPAGASAADAVEASGIAIRHPGIDAGCLGVFGRRVAPATRLADGDRVEIYRRLLLDPKEARRARARRTRSLSRRKPR